MKIGKGIVKKYSREYNRTLKNGERKKYTTEQIQITVPKNEDIYNNKEEVLIIPHDEIETFKGREEENQALKIANYLYVEEVKKLEQQLEESKHPSTLEYETEIEKLKAELSEKDGALSEMENKYETLHEDNINNLREENFLIKDKHSKLIIENENLKTKYSSIKEENKNLKNKCSNLKEEHENIKDSYNRITDKYDQLKHENLNTKTSYAEIYELNEGLEKDYDELRLEYNDLVDKYNNLEQELYHLKNTKTHDEYIANKVKEFILKSRI